MFLLLAYLGLAFNIASAAEVIFAVKDPPLVLLTGINASVEFNILAAGIDSGTEILIEVVEDIDEADAAARSASLLPSTGNVMGKQSILVQSELTQVSGSVEIRSTSSGTKDVVFLVHWNRTVVATDSIRSLRTIPGGLCLLPSAMIIITAIQTRNVVLALFMGLFIGGTLISPGYNPILGFMRAGDCFLYDGISGADQGLLLFTWFMSGLVGLITKNGGALALGRAFAPLATTASRAQFFAVCAGCGVFFDDYASILIVGPTMRAVTDECRVSREKLAFIVDTTAAPIASVAVLSTWVGFKLSVVQQQLAALGVQEDGLSVIVRSIPYCFYPLFAVCFAFIVALSGLDYGPMLRAEIKAKAVGAAQEEEQAEAEAEAAASHADAGLAAPDLHPNPDKPARAVNAIAPIVVMLLAMTYGVVSSGTEAYYGAIGDDAPPPSAVDVLSWAQTTEVLIWSSLLADGIAVALTWGQGVLSLEGCMEAWVEGIQSVTLGLLTLVHAWGMGDMAAKLHIGGYVASLVGDSMPAATLPPICFLTSAFISVASGSSWGAMVLLFPLVLPLSLQGQESRETAGELLVHTVGATISGSLFGDHVSPISDTTVLSALSSHCSLMDHVHTQAPYASLSALIAFIVTLFVSLAGSWALYPSLLAGVALLWLALRTLGSPASSSSSSSSTASRPASSRASAAAHQLLWDRFRALTGRCVRGSDDGDSERLFAADSQDDNRGLGARSDRTPQARHGEGSGGIELQSVELADSRQSRR